jgi:hypothetical protein
MVNDQHILNPTPRLNIQRRKIAKSGLRMPGHGAKDKGLSCLEA